ncbi:MAG TPA: LLM class flavin-dependent oxidoreductase [Anaerolineae bacterium]|nr:LLM class flavin-dependent oxidoreductase [Anaerolineae bacterium]
MTKKPFEIGLYSFAERTPDPHTGQLIPAHQRLDNLLESIELADKVGLDVFALGEHHRPDFVASAPAPILAAAAARTQNIRLSSAVTVLSSDDPVRVFQNFATLDLLSHGRAEIMAGRGSFTESFPLFGYDLRDYNTLFSEKLELLLQIRENEHVHWEGRHRAPLTGQGVYPRPYQNPLPIWVAVGGTPQSVARAANLGLPLAIAIIGGQPAQFAPLVQLYRHTAALAGHDPTTLPVSINSHGHLAATNQQAQDEAIPYFQAMMNNIGQERGWPPITRPQMEQSVSLQGANFIGSPDQIIEKILYQHQLFHHDRFLLQLSLGTMPHEQILHAIELLGTKVAPVVRQEIATR